MSDTVKVESNEETPLLGAKTRKSCGLAQRYVLAIMGFLGFVTAYSLRVNFNVALVAMVNYTTVDNVTSDDCPVPKNLNSTAEPAKAGEFNWTEYTQGVLLSSFFYGYICTNVPGGWLASRYGGKWIFGIGVLVPALLSMLTPVLARISVDLIIAVRVLEGMAQGVLFPAMWALLGKWCPPLESSKIAGIVTAGCSFGSIISQPVSGLLCDYGFAGGWPSVFYVFGAVSCVWFIAWCFLVYSCPSSHPLISTHERLFIESSLGTVKHEKPPPTPWLAMMTSLPVWTIIVATICDDFGFYTLMTCLPTYMKQVLHFDMTKNGFLSSLPWLVNFFVNLLIIYPADYIREHGILRTRNARKLFNTLGMGGAGSFLVVLGFYKGCDYLVPVVLLVGALAMSGISVPGYMVNHLDIAPRFSGSTMSLANTLSTISGMVGPYLVGYLTNGQPTQAQWQKVFFITAGMYGLGALTFLLFAKGEEQEWARNKDKEAETILTESSEETLEKKHLRDPLKDDSIVNA
ncbi:unnamed protein product [Owenia fusiformis]|uniref:Sialin n=1 Tax=Owenia fusiformis TaxID=6347 RepID=A0A8J1TTE2_OWEFU|nr:unnamed protein product [Owenia fusiformis]